MPHKELLEDLLIEFDELDMQPMIMVPDPLDRAERWKRELIYAINHLKAEVAREIFEEIKTCLEYEYMSYLKAYDYTLLTRIEELEKKYTEGEK